MTTRRSVAEYLADIEAAATDCLEFVADTEFEAFEVDKKTIAAVVQKLSVIGEAANQIPSDVLQQAPEVDWGRIIGMRNRLVHGYYAIRLSIIWGAALDDLPPLIASIQRLQDGRRGGAG